eukprot:TRINITY_DN70697_c0_g3_i4.p1 TRINITY_DN70697_c0_g3~~TRINITY_DN70697_c0_g3_i4.p1  ORF type:complete len:359 (+),score=25.63 TRINITY_DN70697_c0_g3_i4:3-1079(+)
MLRTVRGLWAGRENEGGEGGLPSSLLLAVEGLRLSRRDIQRCEALGPAASAAAALGVKGHFLRLRLGRKEEGQGGTGYRMARITGVLSTSMLSKRRAAAEPAAVAGPSAKVLLQIPSSEGRKEGLGLVSASQAARPRTANAVPLAIVVETGGREATPGENSIPAAAAAAPHDAAAGVMEFDALPECDSLPLGGIGRSNQHFYQAPLDELPTPKAMESSRPVFPAATDKEAAVAVALAAAVPAVPTEEQAGLQAAPGTAGEAMLPTIAAPLPAAAAGERPAQPAYGRLPFDGAPIALAVDLGDREYTVDGHYVSNKPFMEVEVHEWCSKIWGRGGEGLLASMISPNELQARAERFIIWQ